MHRYLNSRYSKTNQLINIWEQARTQNCMLVHRTAAVLMCVVPKRSVPFAHLCTERLIAHLINLSMWTTTCVNLSCLCGWGWLLTCACMTYSVKGLLCAPLNVRKDFINIGWLQNLPLVIDNSGHLQYYLMSINGTALHVKADLAKNSHAVVGMAWTLPKTSSRIGNYRSVEARTCNTSSWLSCLRVRTERNLCGWRIIRVLVRKRPWSVDWTIYQCHQVDLTKTRSIQPQS